MSPATATETLRFDLARTRQESHLTPQLDDTPEDLLSELSHFGRARLVRCLWQEEHGHQDTPLHVQKMSEYARIMAKHASMPDPQWIKITAALHDTGKRDRIARLISKPAKLTDEERLVVQEHTTIGAEILRGHASMLTHDALGRHLLNDAATVAESHHEKYDGTGYPHKLRGNQIPFAAQVTALADAIDAMQSKRVYKKGMTWEQVDEIVQKDEGTHFSPRAVEAYFRGREEIVAFAAQQRKALSLQTSYRMENLVYA